MLQHLFLWGFFLCLNSGYRCSSMTRDIVFTKVKTDYAKLWSPSPMTIWTSLSAIDCAKQCLDKNPNCAAIFYNNITLECMLGQCAQSFIVSSSSRIYQTQQTNCTDHPGFSFVRNGTISACLFYFSDKAAFNNARTVCLAKGAILATFKTWEKLQLLQKFIDYDSFIGLDDIETEGVYKWHDDGSVLDLNYEMQIFQQGEPNDYNGQEDCVLATAASVPRLVDITCNSIFHYVCEIVCYTL